MRSNLKISIWLLLIPVVAFFYIGLFLTIKIWYPIGLSYEVFMQHLINFSIIYVLWVGVFFIYQLLDLEILRSLPRILFRIGFVSVILLLTAVVYFYFQPELMITPRRFLLVHILLSGVGITLWYAVMHLVLPKTWIRQIYTHPNFEEIESLLELIKRYEYLGLRYSGTASSEQNIPAGALMVFPSRTNINSIDVQSLYALRRQGLRFVEFYEFYESISRKVHLETLNEMWFIHSVDYGAHKLFDLAKRMIDIILGLFGVVMLLATFPVIALVIKLTSPGSVFFAQPRIGQQGTTFTLYKYRTMTTDSPSNTWAQSDQKITLIGKFLRATRLDELPQSLNILKGDMSIVGPRPEQVNIVEQLRQQIPYYDERHIVKPGLTGWAQLHVYASTLEETKRKLQYDLYYIKHRSLLFDAEIILKTIYNIISFSGR